VSLAEELYGLVAELYPICRSITGDGVRQTLAMVGREIPVEVHEVPSGTQVFDWTVPPEWNLRRGWVTDPFGRTVIDTAQSNLHVVSYSTPVDRTMPLGELKRHVFTLPEDPDWIPYRTSYYSQSWGLCATQRLVDSLAEGDYRVRIDATLEPGSLTFGEHVVAGDSEQEALVSCHVCHPSLANDNLSGIAVATHLAKRLAAQPRRRLTYRFVFVPGTIGSITWLARNQQHLGRIQHGLVLACVGDRGQLSYKRSRRGDASVDRAMAYVLQHSGRPHRLIDFEPYGYDERQYCSPGFDLPVGCLSRTPYGRYREYHTSADDLGLVSGEAMADTLEVCWETIAILEADRRYRNLRPWGEPQLGRRGLYGQIGGRSDAEVRQLAMLWVLNQSDGSRGLLEIAERSGLPFPLVAETAHTLQDAELLAPAG
jgi:aminopeptidase-like protein